MTLRDEIPTDPLRAKVSMCFCVAAALRYGRLSWREFSDETLADPGLQDLMRRVSIRGHYQHRVCLDQHRFPGVRIKNVGKQLLGRVNVGPIDQLVGCLTLIQGVAA